MAKKKQKGATWIAAAVSAKTEGSFTAWCKKQGYKSTTLACIRKGKGSRIPTTRQRAVLAGTFHRLAAAKRTKGLRRRSRTGKR